LRDAAGSKAMESHAKNLSSVPDASGLSDVSSTSGCAVVAPGIDATLWLRTELFFGTDKPDGTAVSAAEWEAFLDAEITRASRRG
jgi:hypothetical protein